MALWQYLSGWDHQMEGPQLLTLAPSPSALIQLQANYDSGHYSSLTMVHTYAML